MSIERMDHPAVSLVLGGGIDLPNQAARARATWLAGRQGRPPVLLVALLWARECPDVVQQLEGYLDALFADYRCTPAGWSEVQAARQVLAALNQQLFHSRQTGRRVPQLDAGVLLLQGDAAQFLQAGAVGLRRYKGGSLQSLPGREDMQLGLQAELALVQHSLPLTEGEALLLAPQPLLGVADLDSFRTGCAVLAVESLPALLAPLLKAPGAAVLLLAGAAASLPPPTPREQWPALAEAAAGILLDGWTLLDECPFGPAGRLFQARDESGREALLWLAAQAADEVFWQRAWALRRSPVASLPRVLSSHRPRQHAFMLFELPAPGMRSLVDWAAGHGPVDGSTLLALLDQAIAAVRALQRRGMQGLWLSPRNILIGESGRLLLLPEYAALLPGVPRQQLPAEAIPQAPELRGEQRLDGRADQFALAALAYWLICGQWPKIACPEGAASSRYVPLASFTTHLPAGWDGVLARALAPQPAARFEALSEFRQALQEPLAHPPALVRINLRAQPWRLALLGAVVLQLGFGLWLSLLG
ncbi:serine/threonine-protein kinase [Pseudomonas paeninsulae]|uniref:protein kinase n=1 Tax=Pseudomonas paeninsulae TaxID=3110772 RepID=UPI002D7A1F18|nr:protein kinase [Pseudomonas sp. IT1137]